MWACLLVGGGVARVCTWACVWVCVGGACLCVVCVVGVGLSWLLCGRARVWAKNDSSVVWFVNLGVSWLNFRELSVVDSGFVF